MVYTSAHTYAYEGKLKELEEYLRSNPNHINEKDSVRILLLLLEVVLLLSLLVLLLLILY
jgi:hypothetical protein